MAAHDLAPQSPALQSPARLSTAPLLQRIAAELLNCQAILSRIEHSVHQSLQGPAAQIAPLSWQKNLQDIDLLEQNLGDLAVCLTAVAAEPPLRDAADLNEAHVLGPLRLEDLRHRLHGKPHQPGCAEQIEIF
jgi:hypothetical protein